MKKLIFKIILGATMVFTGASLVSPITASANEGAETPVESVVVEDASNVSSETEAQENAPKETADEWFDKVLMPLLMQVGAEVGAFALVVWMMLKDLNKTKAMLAESVTALITSNGNNSDTAKSVEELKAEYEKRMEAMESLVSSMGEMFAAALKELKVSLGDKVADADDLLHKLLEVEKLAYGDNAALVSNGTAKMIAEVVGYGNGKVESNE